MPAKSLTVAPATSIPIADRRPRSPVAIRVPLTAVCLTPSTMVVLVVREHSESRTISWPLCGRLTSGIGPLAARSVTGHLFAGESEPRGDKTGT